MTSKTSTGLRQVRSTAATIAAATLVAVLASGCGNDDAASAAPAGWGSLKSEGVTVGYPKGWKALPPGRSGKAKGVAATLTRNGQVVAELELRPKFMQTSDVDMASQGARATYVLGAGSESEKNIRVKGSDAARRTVYAPQKSNGAEHMPPAGTEVEGTDVVGMADGSPFLVRTVWKQGAVPASDVDRIVKSIQVG
ncbi:hypothetical protein ACWCP6_05315 [Streptomyces sp. NPDC002004]